MTRAARGGRTAHHSGLAAEDVVASDYARRGHATRSRRWRGSGGEIDLIATDGEGLIFIEVKKAATHAYAAERLSAGQMGRIQASASEYLGGMPLGQLTPCRFDVALVDGAGRIEILENAIGF
jgi:putative endonuclease